MSYDMYMGLIRSAFYTFLHKNNVYCTNIHSFDLSLLFNGQGKKNKKTKFTVTESTQSSNQNN